MEKLSRIYGWTPEQMRAMRVEDIQIYLDIISMRNQLKKTKRK